MRTRVLGGILVGVLLGSLLAGTTEAQPGPFSAQIQRAIASLTSGSIPFTGAPTININGIATTSTNGLTLANTTAATAGVPVQMSPRTRWCGAAWNSVSMASETDCLFAEVLPATNAGTTTARWKLGLSLAGGAATYPLQVYSNSELILGAGVISGVAGTLDLPVNGGIYWNGSAAMYSPGSSLFRFAPAADTTGFLFDAGTDGTAKFKNFANNAYATVDALGYNVGGVVAVSGTAPTIASGFGTTPSIVASNGTAAFTINVGTGGTATSGVLTMPAATTGWALNCNNLTAKTSTISQTVQTATTTTSATIGNFSDLSAPAAWGASNIISCTATGY